MKNQYTNIVLALVFMTMLSACGTSTKAKYVRDGYMKTINNTVTLGVLFDSQSSRRTLWKVCTLEDDRWSDKEYSLIEAYLESSGQSIAVQFVMVDVTHSFELQGATVDGQFVDAEYLIQKMYSDYGTKELALAQ